MAKKTMGSAAFVAVAVMAIGNAGGRVCAGLLSDKIGRRWTLMLVLLIQAVLMLFRQGALVILAGMLPLAAAGTLNPATRPWFRRTRATASKAVITVSHSSSGSAMASAASAAASA